MDRNKTLLTILLCMHVKGAESQVLLHCTVKSIKVMLIKFIYIFQFDFICKIPVFIVYIQ